jgi:uncharacterized tellurite resistance protein B-like protein
MDGLTRRDRIGYLANVLRIAHADGELSGTERHVFDEVAARLGANASEIAGARQILFSGEVEVQQAGNPASQLANYDDMLVMAMSDGRLEDAEKLNLEESASVLGLSQADVNMALRRAANRLAAIRERLPVAPSLPDREEAVHTPPTPPTGTRTERGFSSAKPPVRKTVAPHLSERMKGPWEPRHARPPAEPEAQASAPPPAPAEATLPPTPSPPPAPEPMPPPEPTPVPSAETPLARCMLARERATDGPTYCYGIGTTAANPWGCRLACMPLMPGAEWLACGTFRDGHNFVFDRERITQLLEQNLSTASTCPHLCLTQVMRTLAAFPARAMPGPLWTWRDAASDEPGTTLPQRSYVHGCAVNTMHRVAAPAPVGDALLRRLLRDTHAPVERGASPRR